VIDRPAYGYISLAQDDRPDAETRLRWSLVECARLEGLQLRSVFVDHPDDSPYAFSAMREVLRRRTDIRAVVLPDLTHVAHIPTVAGLTHAGLARYLGIGVLLATPHHDAAHHRRR
jgi:hypothetical protein